MWFFTTLLAIIGSSLLGHALGGYVGWGAFLLFVALWRE